MDVLRYFLSKLFPAASSFIFVKLIYDHLGSSEYGKYALIYSSVLLVVSFTTGFFKQIILKFYSGTDNHKLPDVSFGMLLLGCVAIIVFSFIFIEENKYYVMLFSIAMLFQLIYITICQANQDSRSFLFSETWRALYFIISSLLVIFLNLGVEHLIFLLCLSYILSIKKYFFLSLTSLKISLEFMHYKKIYYALPISLWLLVQAGFPLVERNTVGDLFSSDVLGSYALVNEYVVRAFSLLLMPFALSIHPKVMKLYELKEFNEINKVILKALIWQVAISSVYVGVVYLFSELFFELAFNDLNYDVISMSWIFALTGSIWQLAIILQKYFEISGQTVKMFFCISLSFIVYYFLTKVFLFKFTLEYIAFSQLSVAILYLLLSSFFAIYFNCFHIKKMTQSISIN